MNPSTVQSFIAHLLRSELDDDEGLRLDRQLRFDVGTVAIVGTTDLRRLGRRVAFVQGRQWRYGRLASPYGHRIRLELSCHPEVFRLACDVFTLSK